MALVLGDPDLGIEIPIPLDGDVLESFLVQWRFSQECGHYDGYRARVGAKLVEFIQSSLDSDFQPPSPAQRSFAAAIHRRLGVPIPPGALRRRCEMHDFLSSHADEYKALVGRDTWKPKD